MKLAKVKGTQKSGFYSMLYSEPWEISQILPLSEIFEQISK